MRPPDHDQPAPANPAPDGANELPTVRDVTGAVCGVDDGPAPARTTGRPPIQ